MSDPPLKFALESGSLFIYASAKDLRRAADRVEAGKTITFDDAEDVMIDQAIPVTIGPSYEE